MVYAHARSGETSPVRASLNPEKNNIFVYEARELRKYDEGRKIGLRAVSVINCRQRVQSCILDTSTLYIYIYIYIYSVYIFGIYICIPKSRVTYGFIGRVAAVYEGPSADLSLLHEDGANRRVTGRG